MSEKLLFFILIAFLTSCADDTPKAESGTYLGGEVINPVSNYVILEKNDVFLDSISLDQNNKFLYKLSDTQKGIYTFRHNEEQIVYLEPGDSLLLRVNTFEFDETLTYSGFGAPENNLLIEFFLKNEEENDLMIQREIYQQDPATFSRSVLAFRKERQDRLDEFLKKHEVSIYFERLGQAIVDYDYFARLEVYPMSHFGVDRVEFIKSLPNSFYDYRKEVDFNAPEFLELYPYQRFLFNYFNQAAFKEYFTDEAYDPLSFTHNLHKLRLIQTEIKNDSVKSFLLTRTIKDYLANSNDKKGGETLYEMYMNQVPSERDKKEIRDLYTANKKIETGKRIPDEQLLTLEKDTVTFETTIKKPAFIFFWSNENKNHAKRAQRLADSYIEKFPEFTFMAINVRDNYSSWKKSIDRYGFEPEQQYLFTGDYNRLVKDLALSSTLKTFIVDEEGFIINAHTNLFSTTFENELLSALNN
ncbi:TlpA family protein disulfide reductase [Leeuwenhoekiella nanhaiensis]|uniref:Thioredoxin domain-containing protein n=1 Tax=Leeuwenhoekiella nanhaiensis TaxID=1655491 RepID=A0A2G1VQU5_9FLAO|nr:hypothetical protein [Leeuwenhoekiella nanhaiensis]PHQ29142.1 hypothetical protein CJ305_11070 [Leeuwenhoekiella nanhaiensis]